MPPSPPSSAALPPPPPPQTPSTFSPNRFGFAVAINADYVVVGAPGEGDQQGKVYVFTTNQTANFTTSAVAELTPETSTPGDQFGYSVTIAGAPRHTIAVGAPGQSAVYLFESRARDVWKQMNYGENLRGYEDGAFTTSDQPPVPPSPPPGAAPPTLPPYGWGAASNPMREPGTLRSRFPVYGDQEHQLGTAVAIGTRLRQYTDFTSSGVVRSEQDILVMGAPQAAYINGGAATPGSGGAYLAIACPDGGC